MQHVNVDGVDVMLNDAESKYWVDTGDFKRIPEGDEEDAAYCELRDRMIADGNEEFYLLCCPPREPCPPHFYRWAMNRKGWP